MKIYIVYHLVRGESRENTVEAFARNLDEYFDLSKSFLTTDYNEAKKLYDSVECCEAWKADYHLWFFEGVMLAETGISEDEYNEHVAEGETLEEIYDYADGLDYDYKVSTPYKPHYADEEDED